MKVEIEVSEENWKFLQNLMEKINTQDNRATASPYYFCVRTEKEIVVPEGYADKEVYRYDDCTFETKDELREYCKENGKDFDEVIDEAEVFGIKGIDEYDNFFFTKEGYDEHIRQNGHNYNKHDSYVKHAFRNPEMIKLLDTLGEITGKGHNKH